MNTGNLCADPCIDAPAQLHNSRSDHEINRRHRTGAHQPPQPPALLPYTVYGPNSRPNGFVALEREWNALLRRSRFNTIFLTYEWQTTWWNELGEGDLWIVAFRHPQTNELLGIAPLYLIVNTEGEWAGKRKLNLVGCIEVSDYLDIIAAKGYEQAVCQSFHRWLHSADAPQWDVLDLCNLPQDSLTQTHMPAAFDAPGYRVHLRKEDTAPQFTLPLTYDEYLQTLVDKKQRHEIRRKQRRAERETKADFYFVGPQHNLVTEMDDFVALQRASRPDKAEFMTDEMRRFFGAVAKRMLEAGYLRLCFLTLNGEKAASLLAFEYDKRFLLYNSGYDPEAHKQLSPGWVLLAYAIQYAIAVGCHTFDFMQGDEEYKYRFGSHDYDVMRVIVERA